MNSSRPTHLHARQLGPYAYRPVPLLAAADLFPSPGGPQGSGRPPQDGSRLAVLLDSAGGNPRLARRSLLAWRPRAHLWARDGAVVVSRYDGNGESRQEAFEDDPFSILRAMLGQEASDVEWQGPGEEGLPWVGAYGLLCYDAARHIERLPDGAANELGFPDFDLLFPTRWLCFDHERDMVTAVADDPRALDEMEDLVSRAARAPRVQWDLDIEGHSWEESRRTGSNFTKEEFEGIVRRGREYVWAGDVFQTNLSQRLELSYDGPSPLLYRVLRQVNPSPFAGYLHLSGYELFSSSPERLVRLRGRVADARPIAGTRRRGRDFAEDGVLAQDLNLDPKERAEHIMLVDLERNDLGRVCDYGSVHVDELMVNERYSHVIHIVSNVTGTLAAGKDGVDLVRAMFPGGTITGCPKVRCMEIIDELENVRRGPYTGSFGYFGYDGDVDLNIVIRTLVRTEGRVFVQAGAGIVADSVPEREYHETLSKAEAMVRALRQADGLWRTPGGERFAEVALGAAPAQEEG